LNFTVWKWSRIDIERTDLVGKVDCQEKVSENLRDLYERIMVSALVSGIKQAASSFSFG